MPMLMTSVNRTPVAPRRVPPITEAESMVKAMYLAEHTGARIYVPHVSSELGLEQYRKWRRRYDGVFLETCPHYLLFDDSVYDNDDFETAKYVMTPPLRKPEDQKHLWRALRYDDLQVIATDHCPFCMKADHFGMRSAKLRGAHDFSKIPNGAPGIETRLVSLFDIGVMHIHNALHCPSIWEGNVMKEATTQKCIG